MNYILGLDVGIGSIGWAVINLDKYRIEDIGVRIFESGENAKNKSSYCQERRMARGIRRLTRRRSHRKDRLKSHLEIIGLTTKNDIKEYYENGNCNIISSRVRAIDEKISPEELAACLIHICNNRGYNDFYSLNDEDATKEEKSEYEALNKIESLMCSNNYRTVAEMILKDDTFNGDGKYRKYHNSEFSDEINLIKRNRLEEEVNLILEKQREYYTCLNDDAIKKIKDIIFSQRDFEDGPGDKDDKFRKYKGFLDTLGKCRFYPEEKRGERFTAIADVYALVNVLSQYRYYDKNGELCFNSDIAKALVSYALENGNMTKKDLKTITKKFGVIFDDSGTEDTPITKCFRYIKGIKPVFDEFGCDWNELISDYTDVENNLLNRIGDKLSKYITPKRRIKELKKFNFDSKMAEKLSKMKFSGTSNVSYKYMKDAIEAFLGGDIYGNYQASFNKENTYTIKEEDKPYKLPPFKSEDDCEFFKNPVVFRAINETRKIINAVVDKYGYPCAVNIETADEVNKSFADRDKTGRMNKANEAENDRIRKEISNLLKIDENSVRPVQIERYKLWEVQEHKCLYSGKEIADPIPMLEDNDHLYEVDHIIPFSIILDNTINNKALVYVSENQRKGQRTPLMYMTPEQAEGYKSRVNAMMKSKKCSKKKYQYLMLENLDNNNLLSEWKSRNLNDTRYISKYLVNYIRDNLRFNPNNEFADDFSIKASNRVFAVKSKFTSQFRKQWLNSKTWGRKDKEELKKITYLDHAADAIVIANCRPEFVIIAGEKLKLYNIWKQAGKCITDEYTRSLNNCVDTLVKYYGMNRNFVTKILKNPSYKVSPIIPHIADETDNRLRDFNTHRILFNAPDDTNEQITETFVSHNRHLYADDPEFAESLKMPVISYKPERKYTGEITTENPISVKEIDGKIVQLSRVKITKITPKHLSRIRTDDTDLRDSLESALNGKGDTYTIEKYLKDNKLEYFTTLKGRRINKVTITTSPDPKYLKKEISENNYTYLDNTSYYCLEIYKTKDGNNNMLGIAMSDLVKKNKKLYLKSSFKYPKDYSEHIMYLFKGDYLRITDKKGQIKFEGYYKSTKNVNQNRVYNIESNGVDCNPVTIAKNGKIIKLNVDILGKISGYNNGEGISCGEPLSLLKEND